MHPGNESFHPARDRHPVFGPGSGSVPGSGGDMVHPRSFQIDMKQSSNAEIFFCEVTQLAEIFKAVMIFYTRQVPSFGAYPPGCVAFIVGGFGPGVVTAKRVLCSC